MKNKWSLLLILVLILGLLVSGCGDSGNGNEDVLDPDDEDGEEILQEDASLTDIQAKGTLIVGCDDSFPPMGFVDEETGEVIGFDIDLAAAVADKLDVELIVQPIEWSTKEMSLEAGRVDVIWNGYTITKERNEKVEYTKPYLNNEQVIAVLMDSDIQTIADLEGKAVGAQEDSSGLAAIEKNEEFRETLTEVIEHPTYLLSLVDLETTRVDAVVVDKVLINYVMAQQPGKYRLLDESLGDEYYGIGCRQDGVALRQAIDDALDELEADGTVEELSTQWFGENIVIRNVPKLTNDQIAE